MSYIPEVNNGKFSIEILGEDVQIIPGKMYKGSSGKKYKGVHRRFENFRIFGDISVKTRGLFV